MPTLTTGSLNLESPKEKSIDRNRLIHIHLLPKRHVANPALAVGVLKKIHGAAPAHFTLLVFICPKR